MFLQFAMLFTTGNGQRKIRLFNYKYNLTTKIEVIHEACDYLAFCNLLCRKYLAKLSDSEPSSVKEEIMNRLIAIISEYCKETSSFTMSQSFLAHQNLCPTFAYLSSIINSRLLANCQKSTPDSRMA